MKKYDDVAERRFNNEKSNGIHKTHPEALAQKAHLDGQFASKAMDDFFTEAYGQVLCDLFSQWLSTQPHEVKTREFLFSTAMGLGSVREKLIAIEQFGRNVPILKELAKNDQEST